MAAGEYYAQLTPEELEKLLSLDVRDFRQLVEGIMRAMDHRLRNPGQSDLLRIGAAVVGMETFVPARSHVLIAAVAMQMLLEERGPR